MPPLGARLFWGFAERTERARKLLRSGLLFARIASET